MPPRRLKNADKPLKGPNDQFPFFAIITPPVANKPSDDLYAVIRPIGDPNPKRVARRSTRYMKSRAEHENGPPKRVSSIGTNEYHVRKIVEPDMDNLLLVVENNRSVVETCLLKGLLNFERPQTDQCVVKKSSRTCRQISKRLKFPSFPFGVCPFSHNVHLDDLMFPGVLHPPRLPPIPEFPELEEVAPLPPSSPPSPQPAPPEQEVANLKLSDEEPIFAEFTSTPELPVPYSSEFGFSPSAIPSTTPDDCFYGSPQLPPSPPFILQENEEDLIEYETIIPDFGEASSEIQFHQLPNSRQIDSPSSTLSSPQFINHSSTSSSDNEIVHEIHHGFPADQRPISPTNNDENDDGFDSIERSMYLRNRREFEENFGQLRRSSEYGLIEDYNASNTRNNRPRNSPSDDEWRFSPNEIFLLMHQPDFLGEDIDMEDYLDGPD